MKLCNKLNLGFILFLAVSSASIGQNQTSIEVPRVIPPSPDAALLGKYGSIPVGLHTGVPNISIPLYTISSGSLEVPISLSYHASGIKVNETASWVGLGWSLNAGGVVTRSVVDGPDEGGFWEHSVKKNSQITYSDFEYLRGLALDGDGESDYYFYNLMNSSGKFIYRQNDNQNPVLIPEAPIKIVYTGDRFEITDPMGTRYLFGAVEWMIFDTGISYRSSFYLTEIISANGIDHINFAYSYDGTVTESSVSYSETVGAVCTGVGPPTSPQTHDPVSITPTSTTYGALRLSEITYANGKVKFNAVADRIDGPESRLGSIEVYSKNVGGSYTLRKSYSVNTDYFVSSNGAGVFKNRLKLLGIDEKDFSGNAVKSHEFSYNSTLLPYRNSLAQDWWGYYNGQNTNTSLIATETFTYNGVSFTIGGGNRAPHATNMAACILNKVSYPTGGYTEFFYEPHYYEGSPGQSVMAGGLRIKEIKDYTGVGSTPVTKLYKYGAEESGRGILLIPTDAFSSHKQLNYIKLNTGSPQCLLACETTRLMITSRPQYELTALNGAPVVYPEVAVYESALSAPNGKTVHQFDVVVDSFLGADQAYNNGRIQINDSWKGGDETLKASYSANGDKLAESSNTYTLYNQQEIVGTKVGWRVTITGGCGPPVGLGPHNPADYFYYFDYPIRTGVKKLTSNVEVAYSTDDPTRYVQWQNSFQYLNIGPQHQQLSSKSSISSAGGTIETKYWYPGDYSSVENISSLLSKNIIATPIKEETYINGEIVTGKVNRLNADGKPYEIYQYETTSPQTPPAHSNSQIVPAGYSKKADITYDGPGKFISQIKLSDQNTISYIWGYNNTQPTAEIINATAATVAYSSFESDGKGNWSYSGPIYNDATVKTGKYYYKLGGGNITKSLAAGTYKLDYWAKGTVTLSGGTIADIRTSTADPNGWVLYEKQVTLSATTTLTLSGSSSVHIDELKVYPITAQMKTYTYDPLVGITSATDTNGLITYYEYDAVGRLKLIRDHENNILKAYTYNYQN